MRQYQIKTGVKIFGRNVYRCDAGLVKIGWKGPAVPLESALAELSLPLSQALRDACDDIDRNQATGEFFAQAQAQNRLLAKSVDGMTRDTEAGSPWHRDENPGLYASMPPDVACREYEDSKPSRDDLVRAGLLESEAYRDFPGDERVFGEDTNPNNVPF